MKKFNNFNQQQQHHQQELIQQHRNFTNSRPIQNNTHKFPKKIVKSSTTMFHQESSGQNSIQHQFFPHSTSYDNMSSLNKMSSSKPMKPLVNDFLAQNSNDFLLESSFNNTNNNNNRYAYYNQQNSMNSKNNFQQQQANSSHNSSILNNSTNSNASGKDLPILHVRNLDYKISADEWKRILLENFRKHCKEVRSYIVYRKRNQI